MLTLLSALVALGCILASTRRLAWAVAPTSLDAGALLDALRGAGPGTLPALRGAVRGDPEPSWERDLLEAVSEASAESREAATGEQILELDWRSQRWARVPRVCASIATSAGFLCASVALMQGLALPVDDVGPATNAALFSALNALAMGIAGTSFCVAVHLRARAVVRARRQAGERLVGRLLALAEETDPPAG